MKSMLDRIKKKISEASRVITDEFYVGQDKKARIRFLSDLEDAFEVTWHDKYEDGINTPCHSYFGLSCPFCDLDKNKIRTRQIFAWTIYNYDIDKKQIFRYPANNFSPIPSLVAMYESYGTLCDRDFVITRTGTGFEMNYQVVPMDKSAFKGDDKLFSKEAICKRWAKMYDIHGAQEEVIKKVEKVKVRAKEKVAEKEENDNMEVFNFNFDKEEEHEE